MFCCRVLSKCEMKVRHLADSFSIETRSYVMSRIRGKDTKPELVVRKYLFSRGLRYRVNDKRYPGNPDIVFPRYKTAVFVNGCFWHSHEGCPVSHIPQTNLEYWEPKLRRTIQRDLYNYAALRADGWNVIVVWECELKKNMRDKCLKILYEQIVGTTRI